MNRREFLRPDQLCSIVKISKRQSYRVFERVNIRGIPMMRVPQEIRSMEPGDKLLKIGEAASLLRVSNSTVNRWFWEGKLSGTKLGNDDKSSIRIFLSSVNKLIEDGEMGCDR